ncbi:hypothetical protein C0993_005650 [Termitomyces sp. T159_Od127]|nr:hypothetical protein C0993_005650 [Termitomyces sp. T159_Od127]
MPVVSAVTVLVGSYIPPLGIALGAAGVTAVAIEFLYHKYQEAPETALFLEAYIVDLTLFLHELFVTALQTEWPKPLDRKLVLATFEHFKRTKSEELHQIIRDSDLTPREALFTGKTKRNVGDLIREQLRLVDETVPTPDII